MRRGQRIFIVVFVMSSLMLAANGSAARRQRSMIELLSSTGSQAPLLQYWQAYPAHAPASLGTSFARRSSAVGPSHPENGRGSTPGSLRFTTDTTASPQAEESLSVCRDKPSELIAGTNDYRLGGSGSRNVGGWQYSSDGGRSLTKDGLLPTVDGLPSGGDPSFATSPAGRGCALYGSNINYLFGGSGDPLRSGVVGYRTTPAVLASSNCDPAIEPSDADCWPRTKVIISTSDPTQFYDKDWMATGNDGSGGQVTWFTYTHLYNRTCTDADHCLADTNIEAVRCDIRLTACGSPSVLDTVTSTTDPGPYLQGSQVSVGADGRTYATWVEFDCGVCGQTSPWTLTVKMAVAHAGATTFGAPRVVTTISPDANKVGGGLRCESDPASDTGQSGPCLSADPFRATTLPQSTVRQVDGHPRVFVTWEECRYTVASICEEPQIRLAYAGHGSSAPWTIRAISANHASNFFPTISKGAGGKPVVAYYSTNRDSRDHRYDVMLATIDPRTGAVLRTQRVTRSAIEPDADPSLRGTFIGDYFQVAAHDGRAYVYFNASFDRVQIGGVGAGLLQQDSFLVRVRT